MQAESEEAREKRLTEVLSAVEAEKEQVDPSCDAQMQDPSHVHQIIVPTDDMLLVQAQPPTAFVSIEWVGPPRGGVPRFHFGGDWDGRMAHIVRAQFFRHYRRYQNVRAEEVKKNKVAAAEPPALVPTLSKEPVNV